MIDTVEVVRRLAVTAAWRRVEFALEGTPFTDWQQPSAIVVRTRTELVVPAAVQIGGDRVT